MMTAIFAHRRGFLAMFRLITWYRSFANGLKAREDHS